MKVRLDFMIFCGLDLHAPVPDETTHCRFRNALVKGGVYDDLLAEVCRQIEEYGLKLNHGKCELIQFKANRTIHYLDGTPIPHKDEARYCTRFAVSAGLGMDLFAEAPIEKKQICYFLLGSKLVVLRLILAPSWVASWDPVGTKV